MAVRTAEFHIVDMGGVTEVAEFDREGPFAYRTVTACTLAGCLVVMAALAVGLCQPQMLSGRLALLVISVAGLAVQTLAHDVSGV